MFTPTKILPFLQGFANTNTFYLAYSGGLDSHVLISAVNTIRHSLPEKSFVAVHVNHGLSPHANAWQNHCQRICNHLKLPLKIFTVDARAATGESPEAAARTARYKILAELITENACLLTAHQQDDQAETVLLQLFRGSGPKGLASMPRIKKFGRGFLARPLLEFSREQLHDYAVKNTLKWIEDESNFSDKFPRNYLRHKIIPLIKRRWPQLNKTLERAAQLQSLSLEIHHDIATEDFALCQGEQEGTLSISKLIALSTARRNNLIHFWLRHLGYSVLNAVQLEQLQRNILFAARDSRAELHWGTVTVRRFRDDLYAMHAQPESPKIDHAVIVPWQLPALASVKDHEYLKQLPKPLGTLVAKPAHGTGIAIRMAQNVSVRFRQGGEKLQPLGRKETHTLKNLFQEWRVTPWTRTKVPLIYIGDELAAVVGHCVCTKFAATNDELGWQITHNE
jgi:tRNA(Ile)-lysidine synthase